MAESIISAPSVKDLERAIEIEAAKSNPDFNVIKELVDASKTILEQSGGPLRPPTKQETISKYVSQEPVSKQLLRGIQTAPERAFQGLFSGSDAITIFFLTKFNNPGSGEFASGLGLVNN